MVVELNTSDCAVYGRSDTTLGGFHSCADKNGAQVEVSKSKYHKGIPIEMLF